MAQVISVVLFLVGLVMVVVKGNNGDKLDNLYNEIGNEEDIRF